MKAPSTAPAGSRHQPEAGFRVLAADDLARGEPVTAQPLHMAEAGQVVAALRGAYRRMCSCTSERDEALQRSRQPALEAQHDALTQLLNRVALEAVLTAADAAMYRAKAAGKNDFRVSSFASP